MKAQTLVAKDIFTVDPLQDYLDQFEIEYLQDLLGADLYAEFAIDFAILGTGPTDPKFLEIWNAFAIDSTDIKRSQGMKKMLSKFIYFEWLRDAVTKNNISGPQKNEQANSEAANMDATNIYTNYNSALETFCSIQWLILDNPNNYDWSKYNGQSLETIGFI